MEGKTAIVTGAGSGIGKAAALKLAEHGAKVCLIDLKPERVAEMKELIAQKGGEAIGFAVDITYPDQLKEAIDSAGKQWGKIDALFVNAGINGKWAAIEHFPEEDWELTINTNLRSTFLSVKYGIPYMKENGGSIVITSSINGSRRFVGFGASVYSISKAGQIAFAKMAAVELARYRIRVNAICPGAIRTQIGENTFIDDTVKEIAIPIEYPQGSIPLGKRGEPEQVADLVLFLASDESSHITGTEIYIDGAESLL